LLAQEGSGNWTNGTSSGHQNDVFVPSFTTGNTGYNTRGFMMLPSIASSSQISNSGDRTAYNNAYDPGHRFYVFVKQGETVFWGFHRNSGSGNITATWYYDNRTDDG